MKKKIVNLLLLLFLPPYPGTNNKISSAFRQLHFSRCFSLNVHFDKAQYQMYVQRSFIPATEREHYPEGSFLRQYFHCLTSLGSAEDTS